MAKFPINHFGPHPGGFGYTIHKGPVETCPDPACQDAEDRWGVWCPHGMKIVEKDVDNADCDAYPGGRVVDPWPCASCTLADFEQDNAQAEAEYFESEWNLFCHTYWS